MAAIGTHFPLLLLIHAAQRKSYLRHVIIITPNLLRLGILAPICCHHSPFAHTFCWAKLIIHISSSLYMCCVHQRSHKVFIHNNNDLHFTRASCRKSSSVSRPSVRPLASAKCKVSLCKCCWHGTLVRFAWGTRPTNVCTTYTLTQSTQERACDAPRKCILTHT